VHEIEIILPTEKTWSKGTWSLDEVLLKKRINEVLSYLCDRAGSVNIVFVSDEEMRVYNETYRGKNRSTDVLSFSPDWKYLPDDESRGFLGDMILSLDFHLRELPSGETITLSLERSIIHGLLHLRGFDHERGAQHHKIMMSLQKSLHSALIQTMGLPQWISLFRERSK
jgi:probable rRNA maturation factor